MIDLLCIRYGALEVWIRLKLDYTLLPMRSKGDGENGKTEETLQFPLFGVLCFCYFKPMLIVIVYARPFFYEQRRQSSFLLLQNESFHEMDYSHPY